MLNLADVDASDIGGRRDRDGRAMEMEALVDAALQEGRGVRRRRVRD
jgi:hypothetical protein